MAAARSNQREAAFAASSVPENYEARLAPVIFTAWAEKLVNAVGVRPGDQVLDVASGTGVVARLAGRHAGPDGRVVASDVSGPMLAHAATHGASAAVAPIEYLQASATELTVPDASFDIVLCQQGMQFFADRPAAAAEMRRVLRPGGAAGLSVWAADERLNPFDDYVEAIGAAGIEPPFPGAFEPSTFKMPPDEIEALLADAGFASVTVSVDEHTITWPDAETAAAGILGTPFGPLVVSLPPERRAELDRDLTRRLAAGAPATEPLRQRMVAVIARATA